MLRFHYCCNLFSYKHCLLICPFILILYFIFFCYTALRGGALQQQYFRVKPKDVLAPVGSNVTMVCEVENQSGKVQWTKDGFALGL